MSEIPENNDRSSYVLRVLTNDSTKKGLAAACAGILVGCAMEAFWPSSS